MHYHPTDAEAEREAAMFRAGVGDFVTVEGEAGTLHRVLEDRGDRLLLVALVDMVIRPTVCLSRDFVRIWNGSGSEAMHAAHAAEMRRDCEAE